MKLDVINLVDGARVGGIDLDDRVFGIVPNLGVISDVVRWQMARRQAGTHAVKGRSDVSRTSKKLYRQKGTGNARHGARTANIFRGGGVVFGPVVRSHAFKLNKKVRRLALCSSLSQKVLEGNLMICQTLDFGTSKTVGAKRAMERLGIKTALFVGAGCDNILFRNVVSNLYRVDVLPVGGLNVVSCLLHEKLVIAEDAVPVLMERLLGI